MELDGDDVAMTYIKDVTFNANRPDVEILRMTKVLLETHLLDKLHVITFCFNPWQLGSVVTSCHSLSFNVITTQPPFVMDKWVVGIQQNQRVDYTVNYEVSRFSGSGVQLIKKCKSTHYSFENTF